MVVLCCLYAYSIQRSSAMPISWWQNITELWVQLPRVIEALLLLQPKAIELAMRLSHESGGAQLRPVLVERWLYIIVFLSPVPIPHSRERLVAASYLV